MCLSTVYKNEKNDDNILCRYVASIQADGDQLTFVDVLGTVTTHHRPPGVRGPDRRHRGGGRPVRGERHGGV